VIPETLRAEPFAARFVLRDEKRIAAAVNTSEAPDSLWRQALALAPEIAGGGSSDKAKALRLINPWRLRVPLFDLAAASALARMTGAGLFPPPPCSL
jgi:hypothetical protein